jgi:hypothetical protein
MDGHALAVPKMYVGSRDRGHPNAMLVNSETTRVKTRSETRCLANPSPLVARLKKCFHALTAGALRCRETLVKRRNRILKYEPTVEELEARAVKWWPADIRQEVAGSAPSLILRSTHAQFVELINSVPRDVEAARAHFESSSISQNILVKHLQVLTDFAGEPMKRVHRERINIFGQGATSFQVNYEDAQIEVSIPEFIATKVVDNKRLSVDGPSLTREIFSSTLHCEVIMMLCFGAFAVREPVRNQLSRCDVAAWFGRGSSFLEHLLGRYLEVNRSVSGAESNSLGQILQRQVRDALESRLPKGLVVDINHILQCESGPITSDVFVGNGLRSVAIEVAFQETTNSVIERKGSDAHKRKTELNELAVASAYVIDGVGNFERKSAVGKLCNNSDCTVAFGGPEFDILAKFVEEWLYES